MQQRRFCQATPLACYAEVAANAPDQLQDVMVFDFPPGNDQGTNSHRVEVKRRYDPASIFCLKASIVAA